MKSIFVFIIALFGFILTPFLFAKGEKGGIIFGRYGNLRTHPTVINSQVITKLYKGTALYILDKTPEKVKIGEIEGFWYKIKVLDTNQEGWIFDQYIIFEGDPNIRNYIESVLSSLYYFKEDLRDEIDHIKESVSPANALEKLKNHKPRFLNYIGYYLLAEKNVLAFPVLIMFMNPAYQNDHIKDANYEFTWELLERLTPKVFIRNDFKNFSSWWQKNYGTAQIDIADYELANIFKKIQDNENRIYRNLLGF